MSLIIKGNPYTHYEECRESISGKEYCCDWCGQTKRVLFKYNNQSGYGGDLGYFCNKECYKEYFGIR